MTFTADFRMAGYIQCQDEGEMHDIGGHKARPFGLLILGRYLTRSVHPPSLILNLNGSFRLSEIWGRVRVSLRAKGYL